MAKIIGNTTTTPMAVPDWNQTDETKADFIKNKPTLGALASKSEVTKTDLAADIQASLGKANSALQSIPREYATETYVDRKVADLVDSSPEALDTLNELAAALGDDPNFAATVAQEIGKKVDKDNFAELMDQYLPKNKVVANFGDTEIEVETINDLLRTLYDGFTRGTYTAPEDNTITYSIYGYNEMDGGDLNSDHISFSIGGRFKTVKILGYDNAELKFVTLNPKGDVRFLFSDGETTAVNVKISDITFSSYTPNISSGAWELLYIKPEVGFNGTLSLDNCSFLENGLRLVNGVNNSITNCHFSSIIKDRYCLWLGTSANGGTYFDTLQDVTIDNCTFTGYRSIKILTDTQWDTRAGNAYKDFQRENQSIVIKNCLFKDLIDETTEVEKDKKSKPAIVIYSKFTESSFYTGKSKLKIFNTAFVNCEKGNIILDSAFKDTRGILYSIDGEVRNAYNIKNEDGVIVCETSVMKNLAFIDDFEKLTDGNLVKWSSNKLVDSGKKISDLVDADDLEYRLSTIELTPGPEGPQGEKGDQGDQGIQGEKGDKGDTGATGAQGEKGEDGQDGEDGLTPHIGANGNWWIGTTDTGVKAQGVGISSITSGTESVSGDYTTTPLSIKMTNNTTQTVNIKAYNGNVTELNNTVLNNSEYISDLQSSVMDLSDYVEPFGTNIEELYSITNNHSEDISGLEYTARENSNKIYDLENLVDDLLGRVEWLESKM